MLLNPQQDDWIEVMTEPYHYPDTLELVHYPDPVLRRQTEPVTEFDDGLAAFCERMIAAMRRFQGVGLAAPQVGVSKAIFVSDHAAREEDAEPDPRVWINPRLEATTGSTVYEEGCLSFPNIYAKVERFDAFDVVWNDVTGAEQRLHVPENEFLGIVIQHELDHLSGKLFVDLLSPGQITMVRRKLRDLESAYKKRTGKAGAVLRR
jgi:peptide deformylase